MVATTMNPEDDEIVKLCKKLSIECFQGSENDVLDRYYYASKSAGALKNDIIVRITGDCPLIDTEVVDDVIKLFKDSKVDYASNVNPPTFPDGMDVEAFNFNSLENAWNNAQLKSEREHVTPYIRNHPETFSQINLKYKKDLSQLRLTVDMTEDFEVIKIIIEDLYKVYGFLFGLEEIISYLEKNIEVLKINGDFFRNEGYSKSLMMD